MRTFNSALLAVAGTFLSNRHLRAIGQKRIERDRIKTSGPDAPIATLSGGNMLTRELGSGTAKVLMVANPYFGLVFAARRFHQFQELLALSHRVLAKAE